MIDVARFGQHLSDGRGCETEEQPNTAGMPFVFYVVVRCVPRSFGVFIVIKLLSVFG